MNYNSTKDLAKELSRKWCNISWLNGVGVRGADHLVFYLVNLNHKKEIVKAIEEEFKFNGIVDFELTGKEKLHSENH